MDLTLAGLAEALASYSASDAYRAVLGWIADTAAFGDVQVEQAMVHEPMPTGDHRVDSLLAAAAEHVAFHREIDVPTWCVNPSRSMRRSWFPVDLPSIRARALVSSPASFWRRGIFIDRSDLARV